MRTKSRRMVEKGSRGESQLLFWHLFSLIDDNANGSFFFLAVVVDRGCSLSLFNFRVAGSFPNFVLRSFHARAPKKPIAPAAPLSLASLRKVHYFGIYWYYGRWRRQSDSDKKNGEVATGYIAMVFLLGT